MRLFAVLLVVALAMTPAPSVGLSPAPRVELRHALAVLHAWDQRRAHAWARSDEGALRSLYVRGSGAARADVRLLHAYTARGFVVRRLVTQVFGVRVLRSNAESLVVTVLDRVSGGEVANLDGGRRLPSTHPAVRRVAFVRVGGTWVVDQVSGSG